MTFPHACCVCLLLLAATAADAQAQLLRLRASDPTIQRALAEGERGSATFRRLVTTIRRSDLIVHVLPMNRRRRADGCLVFVTAAGAARYLRIFVRVDLSLPSLVGLLGHELTHAAEIASEPAVRDGTGMRGLYERIGQPGHAAGTFDTAAAVAAGRQVYDELRRVGSPAG